MAKPFHEGAVVEIRSIPLGATCVIGGEQRHPHPGETFIIERKYWANYLGRSFFILRGVSQRGGTPLGFYGSNLRWPKRRHPLDP